MLDDSCIVQRLNSILVIMDPLDQTRHTIGRAIILARHFDASLELFRCDAQSVYELDHAYDASGVPAARRENLRASQRYLESVRRSVAEDVRITLYAACESSLCEAVVHRVHAVRPDLVIKGAAGQDPHCDLDGSDWQLARTCPVPLMLTHGRPWNARPTFAAVSESADARAAWEPDSAVHAAAFLANGLQAQLDVLVEGQAPSPSAPLHARTIRLRGAVEQALPPLAAQQDYDVVVLAAGAPLAGSMTFRSLNAKLLASLTCDVLLVPAEPASGMLPGVRTQEIGVSA